MNDLIFPKDPSRVTPDNPHGFYCEPVPADYVDEPWTEEEIHQALHGPYGTPITEILREFEVAHGTGTKS